MKASLSKRFSSYMFDVIIIMFLSIILSGFFYTDELKSINLELNETYEMFLNEEMTVNQFYEKYSELNYKYDYEKVNYSIINITLIISYFIFIPYYNKGRTLGQQIINLKTIRNDESIPTLKNLFLRNIIINGIVFLSISQVLLFILDSKYYFISVSILGFLQIILVIVTVFMLLYRKDNLGLQDIMSGTKVVEKIRGE